MSTISSIKLNGTSYKIDGFDFNLTENGTLQKLNNFNIIYLTEEEYQAKLAAGELDETAFYCTDFEAEEGGDVEGYLPLTAGEENKLTGPLGFTEGIGYGTALPESGFEGQLFLLEDGSEEGGSLPAGGTAGQTLVKNSDVDGDASWQDLVALPEGGTAGQILTKASATDGDAAWEDFPSLNYLPLTGGTVTGVTTFSNTTASSSTTTGAVKVSGGLGVAGNIYGAKVYGAVWNDYAEYRICKENFKPGQVVVENGDDTLRVSKERLFQDGYIVSDTFGFAIGETNEAKCPVAVTGRVLAYTDEPRENFKPGDAVCNLN